jgi:DNA invertase Pin-like site-specific DNA recombinase
MARPYSQDLRDRARVQLAPGAERSLRGLHLQPASRGLDIGEDPLRRWGVLGWEHGAAGTAPAARGHPGGRIDIVVVYKVDRLTRSLADFARLVEIFDAQGVSFVPVTQQFNTTSSMGRLTLNVLLSFAQFEREVTGERIRDKIAASKQKGMWMGGNVPLGYDAGERTLVVNPAEAETVRCIFALYRELGCVRRVKEETDRLGLRTKRSTTASGLERGGKPFARGHIYQLLSNPIYIGQIAHKGQLYPGQHRALIDAETWRAVRDQLATNATNHRRKADAVEPSLLAAQSPRPALPLGPGSFIPAEQFSSNHDRAGHSHPGSLFPALR